MAAGTIWVWGDNSYGQLGTNSTISTSSPVSIARPGSYTSVFQAMRQTFEIDASTGMVYGQGSNTAGQLGDNSQNDRSSPVAIARSGSYTAVVCSDTNGYAIDSNGMIWSWGWNSQGQLGDLTGSPASSPVSIRRAGSYVAISAGDAFACAIDNNGMIWSWGSNSEGQLGDLTLSPASSPVSICRAGSYVAISTGYRHTLAIDSNGMVWAWGSNQDGVLGDNTVANRSSPVAIARSGSYVAVSAGQNHSLAIDSAGMVWAWGQNADGKLGVNDLDHRSSPVSIARLGSYVAISASYNSGYALDYTGVLFAWGANSSGQLGNNSQTPRIAPVPVNSGYNFLSITGGLDSAAGLQGSTLMAPIAEFFSDTVSLSGVHPLSITFTDLSSVATSWAWSFGDGDVSTDQNPIHVYTIAGTYTVTLVATNGVGSDTRTRTNYITVYPSIEDTFPAAIRVVLGTKFTGDARLHGLDSGDILVLHKVSGQTVWTEDGTEIASVTNRLKFEPRQSGNTGYVGVFGQQNGDSGWGSGSTAGFRFGPVSIDVGVTYAFREVWNHDVTGTFNYKSTDYVTGVHYQNEIFSYFDSNIELIADFTADVTSGPAPLTVQFTDTSTGTPTSWAWNFGDSGSSTDQNPQHVYSTAGTYTVALTATNLTGSDTNTKVAYIIVTASGSIFTIVTQNVNLGSVVGCPILNSSGSNIPMTSAPVSVMEGFSGSDLMTPPFNFNPAYGLLLKLFFTEVKAEPVRTYFSYDFSFMGRIKGPFKTFQFYRHDTQDFAITIPLKDWADLANIDVSVQIMPVLPLAHVTLKCTAGIALDAMDRPHAI